MIKIYTTITKIEKDLSKIKDDLRKKICQAEAIDEDLKKCEVKRKQVDDLLELDEIMDMSNPKNIKEILCDLLGVKKTISTDRLIEILKQTL